VPEGWIVSAKRLERNNPILDLSLCNSRITIPFQEVPVMSIKTNDELEKLKIIGKIVRKALDTMTLAVRVGITTSELDEIGENVVTEHGAEPAPSKIYGFPGAVCISVNDEAVHGVPGSRRLCEGDLVKLDLVAAKDGFFADSAITVRVGNVSPIADALVRCAEAAFWQAMKVSRLGFRTCHIGRAIESEVRRSGFNVMPDLGGHGVGRTIHEEPSVPNFYDRTYRTKLSEGLVIAVEPIIAAGTGEGTLQRDRWTVRTTDRSLSAHFEHTVVITRGQPLLLTA
jgi:methionyl aminopeptidase